MAGSSKFVGLMLACIVLLLQPASAQLRFQGFSTDLNGNFETGYNADYGNLISSDHNWTVGGIVNLSGSFYSPNFLSYTANLYLNQSRANSDYQSISNASGVSASANIFGGSKFPGSVSYSKSFNSEGDYAVPGLANYVTHGNSDALGVNWSENLPGIPSVSAGFQMGSSQYSVYGSNDQGDNKFHSLNFRSSYSVAGFNMAGYYTTGDAHSLIPQVISGTANSEEESGNTDYGFNVAHPLPLRGSFSGGVNRSNYTSDYLGTENNGTIDIFNTEASVHPTPRFSLTANASYSDNLTGQLLQSIVAAGAAVPEANSSQSSNSLDLTGTAGYSFLEGLQTSVYVERRSQSYLGETYGDDSFGTSVSYRRRLLDGNFNATFTAVENSNDNNDASSSSVTAATDTGTNVLGFSSIVNYSSVIKGWNVAGAFGYAQNVQTLLITYMNSYYNYSGNARRRFGKLNFTASGGASRTALTEQAGTANSSESFNTSLSYSRWLTASGGYNKSSGQALVTGSGLVPVPIPSPVLPSNLFSLYGGDGYSFAVSSSPIQKLSITASYGKSTSNTTSSGIASTNRNDQYNALVQYQARKLYFNSGYARLGQSFSGSGSPPEVVSSFYIGVSRWFNFF